MAQPRVPEGDRYLWWSQGALDETNARNEGLSSEVQDLRHVLESLARSREVQDVTELLTSVARIYCPGRLRRKYRQ